MDVIEIVHGLIQRELQTFAREIALFPEDELVWQTRPGVANAAGNLALHACGNLQHFVGAVLGGTGYVRRRDEEFATGTRTRAELVADLTATSDVVARTLGGKTLADFPEVFPADLAGSRLPTALFLVHLEAHLAFHLGQAGYLRRVLTGDSAGSGAIALADLSGFAVTEIRPPGSAISASSA